MTKIISDVQIKKLMRICNPSREWSEGCVAMLRAEITTFTGVLLNEIESRMVGNKRVQPQDIADAYNNIANAIMFAKQPVLRHFIDDDDEELSSVQLKTIRDLDDLSQTLELEEEE